MNAQLEITTFGGLRIRLAGDRPTGLATRKAEGLLVYLACQRRAYEREVLGDLLWEDRSQSRALANLRVLLHDLRKSVGDFLVIDHMHVSLNAQRTIWLDVAEMETLLSGWVESKGQVNHKIAADIERAAKLYQGDFLEGFYIRGSSQFEEWLVRERERLRQKLLDALGDLVTYELQTGSFQTGAEHAHRLLELDPLMESAQRQLMLLLAYSGQRAAALEAYRRFRKLLDQELGVEPEAETRRVYEQLQAGDLESQKPEAAPVGVPPLPAFLDQAQGRTQTAPVFVGRQRELAWLEICLGKVLQGEGGVVFITGSSGLGKTTLMEEFARRAMESQPDLLVATGSCSAYTGVGEAYQPFRETLAMLAGDLETRWEVGAISRAHAERLWNALPVMSTALLEKGPDLLQDFISAKHLLSQIPSLASRRVQRPPPEILEKGEGHYPAKLAQQAILSQYQHVLSALTQEHPVLLLLDDMQWADNASIELLFHLGRQLQGQRLLLLVAYRQEETAADSQGISHPLDRVFFEFKRLYGDIWINLSATPEDENRLFVDTFLDREPNNFGPEFRESLFIHTRGHALFLSELLRDLKDRRVLVQDQDGLWVQEQPLDWSILPPRVEGIIEKRLSLLDKEMRELLTWACVEGQRFSAQVLAQVLRVDLRHVLKILSNDLASRYRLVEEIEPNQVDHQKVYQYRFRHAVFQSYLHENLSLIQRELYHAQVGQALEALYAEHVEQVASKLVSHFKIAGDKPRLVKYALQAADRAQHLGASQDAITLYQLALENVQVSEGARQAQTASYICERLGDVYLENLSCHDEALDQYQEFFQTTESELQRARAERKIAAILTLQGDLDQAQKQYESALHRISGKSLSAEAGRIHCGLAYLKIYKSDFDAAQEHARTAAEVASRLEYAEGIADANNALGHIAAYRGDFEASRGFLSTSLQVYRQLGDLPRTAKILNNLGEVSRLLGQMQAAQEYLEQGLGIARRVGDKREEAAVLSTLGDVYRDMGSWEHAVEILEQALPVAEQSGVAIRLIEVHWFLGGAYQQLDQIGRAKDHLEQAERISREKGFSHYLPKIYLELACLFSKEAERDKALAYLERARQAAGEDPGEEFLGQLQCVSGELYQDSQDWEHAIACYQQALVYLGRGGVPAKAARAHLGLGSCYLQRGLAEDRPRARENLQAAQQEFQRIGAEAYLQQVAAQLERLEQGVV